MEDPAACWRHQKWIPTGLIIEESITQPRRLMETALFRSKDMTDAAPVADRLGHILADAQGDEGIFPIKELGVKAKEIVCLLQPIAAQNERLVAAEGEGHRVEMRGCAYHRTSIYDVEMVLSNKNEVFCEGDCIINLPSTDANASSLREEPRSDASSAVSSSLRLALCALA